MYAVVITSVSASNVVGIVAHKGAALMALQQMGQPVTPIVH